MIAVWLVAGLAVAAGQFPPEELYGAKDQQLISEFNCLLERRFEEKGTPSKDSPLFTETGTSAAVLCTKREVDLWRDAHFLWSELRTCERERELIVESGECDSVGPVVDGPLFEFSGQFLWGLVIGIGVAGSVAAVIAAAQ